MFLKLIKDFLIKKSVKKSLSNYKPFVTEDKIQTVGILIDETYFAKESELISEIISKGIRQEDIKVLIFKDKIRKRDMFQNPFFSRKNITIGGEFKKQEIKDFIDAPFDMLISYYDIEKPPLMWLTIHSNAKFKVGFSTIDKRINAFMVGTIAEKHEEFVSELFKYLKILNKI